MKLLVTGGLGFIGSNFIQYWFKKYPRDFIINLDKITYAGNPDNLRKVKNNPNYSFIKGDISDRKLVDTIMDEIDFVVHFAAESHVDRSIFDPALFLRTNILGTGVLLQSSLKYKIKRFHHISTDEVFGSLKLDDKKKFSEQSVYDPHSPYSASKAGSDHLVRAYFHTFGLPVTISNCSNNYGPYQFPEKLIPLTITNILDQKPVPVYGDGFNVRDWLYVEDHCRAIDLILQEGEAGQTYCVGGQTEDISNLTVVKKILQIMDENEDRIRFVKDRPGHDRKYAIDWTKIKKSLGYEPKHDFDTWLEKTIFWYKENTNWWQAVKSKEYHKYYQKQYQNR